MKDIEIIKEKAKKLAEKYGLSLVVLFGSQVSGRTHPMSDYDFGFISEKEKELEEKLKIAYEFSQDLKLGEIDFVDLKNVSPLFMKCVADESVLLYEKGDAVYDRFKIYAFKLYVEAKRLFEMKEESLKLFLATN